MAGETVRLDAAQCGNGDGILQAADQSRGRARQPGRDLSAPPIIVTATFGAEDFALLDGLRRRHFPPERNQVPAHLTLFHQLPPMVERELGGRLAETGRGAVPRAEIAGILDLGRGTAFRVESPELEAIRDELREAFHGLLTPQDAGGWRPHVTIQNKAERKAVAALQAELRATFQPRPLRLRGLASWRYLGGPWELIAQYPFRGP